MPGAAALLTLHLDVERRPEHLAALGLSFSLAACTCGGEELPCDVDSDCGAGLACVQSVCAERIADITCPPLRVACGSRCCGAGEVCAAGRCFRPPSSCEARHDPLVFETPRVAWWWPYTDGTGATKRAIALAEFDQVMSTPAVVPLGHDPGDRLAPAVVFNSFRRGGGRQEEGVLRAVDGRSGAPLWTVTDPALRTNGLAAVAAADIDGDGRVEIVTGAWDPTSAAGGGVIAFRADGSFWWRNGGVQLWWGGATIADLDGAPPAEVIVGAAVLEGTTGRLLCAGAGGQADNGVGPLSTVADLDLDGRPEVVTGTQAYRFLHDSALGWQCAPTWPPTSLPDGFVAVADLDDPRVEPHPEVVVVARGTVRVHAWDGSLRAGPVLLPGGGRGGPPTIADFDGGGDREIGVAGLASLTVFKRDLSVRWSRATQDFSSSMTGTSVFDFTGDGFAEVIYNDECFTRVYSGGTGLVLLEQPNTTCTTYEYPLVVDVDADGRAEIVSVANGVCTTNCPFPQTLRGIQVLESPSDNWVNTRRIWNQHAYTPPMVDDDGRVPSRLPWYWIPPAPNSFRQNVQGAGTFDAPDFSVGGARQRAGGCPASLELEAEIVNRGALSISAPVPVAFYHGDPAAGGTLVGVAFTQGRLEPGAGEIVRVEWPSPPRAPVTIVVRVDEEAPGVGRYRECNEGNNGLSFQGGCPAIEIP